MVRRPAARDAHGSRRARELRVALVAILGFASLSASGCRASESPDATRVEPKPTQAAPSAAAMPARARIDSLPAATASVDAPAAAPAEPNRPAASSSPTTAPEFEYSEITTGRVHGDDKAPLVIALHGLGDTPRGFLGLFDGFTADARVVAPHSDTPYSQGFTWFPPGNGTSDLGAPALAEMASRLATFIATMAARRPTLGKPIVIGFSQGGALSLTVGALHPGAIAAAIPLSGWFPPALWPTSRPNDAVPIVAFHGTADVRVPFGGTKSAIEHLAKLGYPANLREVDGVGHGIAPLEHEAIFEVLAEACAKEAR
jgi:phospholipase/carboxylesterase